MDGQQRDQAADAGADQGRVRVAARLNEHLPQLHAYFRLRMGRALRSFEESVDLVDSVCRQALENASALRGGDDLTLRRWLFTIAQRKLVDRMRHHRAAKRSGGRRTGNAGDGETEMDDGLAACYRTLLTPSRVASAREEVACMEAAFDQLSDGDREIVIQARLLGFSHADIAQRLGRSEGAVRTALYRALARLSHLLRQ